MITKTFRIRCDHLDEGAVDPCGQVFESKPFPAGYPGAPGDTRRAASDQGWDRCIRPMPHPDAEHISGMIDLCPRHALLRAGL